MSGFLSELLLLPSHVPLVLTLTYMALVNKVIRCVRPTVTSSTYLPQINRKLSSVTLMSNTEPAAKKQRMDIKVRSIIHWMYFHHQSLDRP